MVVLVDGDREFFRRDVEPVAGGEEFPCPEDRLALEIITEAEVAKHFEERVVSRSPSDIVDVAGSQALLAGCGPGEFQLALAEEVVLELVHARGREKNGRVPAWHEHVTGAPDATLRFKERQIRFAEFVGLHVVISSR